MARKIKKYYEVGYVSDNIEVVKVYDFTSEANYFDSAYFYDIIDHKTGIKHFQLTYNQVRRAILGKPINKRIVFFIDRDWVERLRYGFLPVDEEGSDCISSSFIQPSKLEMSLINHVANNIVDEDERLETDPDVMYELALHSLDYILDHSDELLDEDAKGYSYEGKIKKLTRYKEGDIIKGKYTSFEIIYKYPNRDKFRRAVFDIKDLRTNYIYLKLNSRDIKRFANNDFPIITVGTETHRLTDWADLLNIDKDTLRKYWREFNGNEEKVAEVIADHLYKLEKGLNKYDGTISRNRNKKD